MAIPRSISCSVGKFAGEGGCGQLYHEFNFFFLEKNSILKKQSKALEEKNHVYAFISFLGV